MPTAALGFRVKSGWAAVVLVEGPASSPRVLDRRVVELNDPAVPASRQPYHAAMGVARGESPELDQLLASVREYARRALAKLLDGYGSGRTLRGGGLVVGSDIEPTRIANLHVRAHAYEGRLFRTVVETALRDHGLACTTFVERDLFARAEAVLERPEKELKRTLTELGRSIEGSWRRDDKMATVAAWLVLAFRRP